MKFKMALTLVALAGSLLAVAPASAVPVGAAGQSIKAEDAVNGLVEQVGHRWRRHHRHRLYAYRYQPRYYSSYRPYYYSSYRPYYYSYQPYYSRPYYSSYYAPYAYGYSGYYGRSYYRPGISIRLRF